MGGIGSEDGEIVVRFGGMVPFDVGQHLDLGDSAEPDDMDEGGEVPEVGGERDSPSVGWRPHRSAEDLARLRVFSDEHGLVG